MDRFLTALRIVVPSIWGGLIIAIDLIEAPLKFQAPGITIPLGLGIGRLVFAGMNVVEVLLVIGLAIALWRTRASVAGRDRTLAIVIGALLVVKVAVLRPLMAAQTDAVIAGTADPGSTIHYVYIGADAVLAAVLVWFLIRQCRELLPARDRRPLAAEARIR